METQKKSGFMSEFKEFISRGSVLDLAVGIIIGGAFTKIVSSFVADIVTPLLSLFMGKIDLTTLKATLPNGIDLTYGVFIQTAIDFLLIALVIFMLIKGINKLHRKQPPAPAKPTHQEELLTEIRDLLKKQS